MTALTPGTRVLARGHQRTYAGTVLEMQSDGYAVVQLDVDRDPTRIYGDDLTARHHGSTSGST